MAQHAMIIVPDDDLAIVQYISLYGPEGTALFTTYSGREGYVNGVYVHAKRTEVRDEFDSWEHVYDIREAQQFHADWSIDEY